MLWFHQWMNQQTHIPSQAASLHLTVIDDLARLAAFKPAWDALHTRDPVVGIFMSYDWLISGFRANPGRWRVFVVADVQGNPLCIFPAKTRVHWSQSAQEFQTEIEAAGRLSWGEHTGFICDPAQEAPALAHLAQALRALPWKTFAIRYETTGRRARLFAEAMGEGFTHRFRDYRINRGQTNNLIGLKTPLPRSFDSFLAEGLSANTRQKIRRYRRKFIDNGIYTIRSATPDTSERDIAGMLQNWALTWAGNKGLDDTLLIAERYARALLNAEALGALYLPTLWQGERMLGGLAHVIDREAGVAHFLLSGRDPEAGDPAIGILLHAQAIEWAIGQGLQTYDFGHGDQPYKYSFGAQEVESFNLEVRRHGQERIFDPCGIKLALERLHAFARAGQLERVQNGSAQLLKVLD